METGGEREQFRVFTVYIKIAKPIENVKLGNEENGSQFTNPF
jgi:hypothetical protein